MPHQKNGIIFERAAIIKPLCLTASSHVPINQRRVTLSCTVNYDNQASLDNVYFNLLPSLEE